MLITKPYDGGQLLLCHETNESYQHLVKSNNQNDGQRLKAAILSRSSSVCAAKNGRRHAKRVPRQTTVSFRGLPGVGDEDSPQQKDDLFD